MSTEAHKSSIEAAQEAIAKVNAMLIAKGKLKPSQLSSPGPRKTGVQSNVITREVEINDVPIGCRNMLTRGATQEEISKLSGAAVATKGRYMSHEDKLRNPKERPLYLHVQGTSQDAVNLAVGRINEIIANGLARQGPRMSRFTARASNPQPGPRHPPPPPPLMGLGNTNQNTTMTLLQEKLYIGLEHAPPNFSVKDKVLGPGGAFLQHIQGETGAKVTLRGKGSGFIEPTGGEAMEPMHVHLQHVNMMGLQQAKELSTNLIQTVQQEYAAFQQSFVSVPPPNMGMPQPSMLVPPPQLVSLAQPPPLLPGQQIMTSVPPPQPILQPPQPQSTYMTPPPPQATLAVSLPAPGVVIPQLAATSPAPTLATQPQPGQLIQQAPPVPVYGQPANMGQPVQQFIQSSEQQIISHIGNQPPVVVSLAPGQQGGQVVYSTVAGQPIQQPVQQIQQQLVPTGSVQLQQPPQAGQVLQPGQVIQQAGIQPQQPMGLQQQITVQQPQQQQILQPQPQPTVISNTQPFIQQPIVQTTVAQIPAPNSNLQPAPNPQHSPLGQPPGIPQPLSWGAPAATYTSVATGSPAPTMYTVVTQQTQGGDMIMSSPQSQTSVALTSSSPTTVTTAPSGYVYKTGPVEEPKRRFTEEKQEDKLPEGLLGYEHGPPHLTNLMVQPGQASQPPQPQQQQPQPQALAQAINADPNQQQAQQPHLIYGQQVLQPQPTDLQHHHHHQQQQQHPQLMYSTQVVQQPAPTMHPQPPQQYTVVTQQQVQQQPQHIYQPPPQPLQQQQLAQIQEVTRIEGELQVPQGQPVGPGEPQSEDKVLMPPPPPPVVNLKRHSPGLSPGPTEPRKKSKGFHDEDDDVDIPSSIASQAKEMKKFSFNQYSSTPQMYSTQTTTAFPQYVAAQNGGQGPGPEFQHEQQYQQQQQPPPQYIQDAQSPGQQYIGLSSPQQNVYGQTYTQYSVATSQAYSPSSAVQQQPPPPPPPQFDAQRSRSPDTGDKTRGFNPQFVPSYTRDENLLRQPPPPPPPPSTARPRTYW